jgi:cell cycle sensor histidine kinase DivJ
LNYPYDPDQSAAAVAAADARATGRAARLWQGGWGLAVAAGAAAMLAALGSLPAETAGAFALGAAPGLVGCFWLPLKDRRLGLMALWAVAMTLAAAAAGGVTGPLGAWCVAPLLLGALFRRVPHGAAMAGAAALVAAGLEWAGVVLTPPDGPAGVVLAAVGLLVLFGAGAWAVVLVLRDVAEREEAIRAEMRWFERALAELPYLGVALDREGRAEAVFGTAPAGLDPERLSQGLIEAAAPDDRPAIYAALCEALDHGAGEAVFSPAGAPERTFQLALRKRGETGLSAVVHDVTAAAGREAGLAAEKARLESALAEHGSGDARVQAAERRAAEADAARAAAEASAAAKSRFLANMSHELRTPLNAIMGFSDIMRARMFGELTPKYGEYADLIHESGGHLLDLINDVLDMSKIEAARYSLTLETFDARDAVNAAMRLMRLQADEAGIQLRGLMPPEPLTVEADRRAVKQIVLNLVSNALKFTPRGGSVTVTARARGREMELVVADTGAGIAPEDLERLGRPYEQAGDAGHRAQGTGLGLSLVKAFAGLHGGAMSIESAAGEGAAVTVRMPVLKGPAPEAAPVELLADAPPDPEPPRPEPSEPEPDPLLETGPVDGEAVLEAEIEEAAAELEPMATDTPDAVAEAAPLPPAPEPAPEPEPESQPEAGSEPAQAGDDAAEAVVEAPPADNVKPFWRPGGTVINLPGPRLP